MAISMFMIQDYLLPQRDFFTTQAMPLNSITVTCSGSGSDDSGLFAIAFVVTLCSGGEPCKQDILPEQIEGRLKKCLITIALSGKSESEKTCHETCKGRIFPSFVCANSLMWARSWFYAKGAIGGITQIVLKSQKVPFKEVHIRLFFVKVALSRLVISYIFASPIALYSALHCITHCNHDA